MDKFLKKYVTPQEISKIKNEIENKQRANILTKKHFLKIGKNTDQLFFENLVKEIELYKLNKNNENFPVIVDSYVDNNCCILVLEKIKGIALGDSRNDFEINITDADRKEIINKIKEIKNIKINIELKNSYERAKSLSKYFERSKKYLTKKQINYINKCKTYITEYNEENVISHGDLICPNIMFTNKKPIFIDWEFIEYRPFSYDVAYFMLFSKEKNCFDYVEEINIDTEEVLKDGIILCLKEIQNWAKLYTYVEDDLVNSKIKRWKKELTFLIKRIEKYEENSNSITSI
jgi:thiamine kinase-like enzyme